MKNIGLAFIAFFLMVGTSQAQISIVPRLGMNISKVSYKSDAPDQSSIMGFNLGLGFNIPFTYDHFLSFQPELNFSQKGYEIDGATNLKYRFNYVEIPVLAKISFGSETIKGYVNMGPHLGYLVGGKVTGNTLADGAQNKLVFTTNPDNGSYHEIDAQRTEIGATFGGGIGFAVGTSTFMIDLRYSAQLNNTLNSVGKSKNQVVTIGAGIQVPLSY